MKKYHLFFDRSDNISYRTQDPKALPELCKILGIEAKMWELLERMLMTDYDEPHGFISLVHTVTGISRAIIEQKLKDIDFFTLQSREHQSYKPFKDSKQAILSAKKHFASINIASDMNKQWSGPSKHEQDIFSLFDSENIFNSYQFGITKGSADFFRNICLHKGVDPQFCLMIGDNEVKDVLNAKKAGFYQAILHRNPVVLAIDHPMYAQLHNPTQFDTIIASSLLESVNLSILSTNIGPL